MLGEGIDEYHNLLTDELAADTQQQLDEQLRVRGLFFGDRPLCSVLRPRFLSPQQYRFLQTRAGVVLRAFRKAHHAALADDAVLDQFRLFDWERDLARVDPGFRDASPVSRLDAFFVAEAGGLRFTEYNAETPAGGAYNDVLTELFFGLPIMREFMRRWDLRPLPARHDVLHALLDAYRQWSGGRALPRIAIVDWSDVPTQSEFVLFQEYFKRQGIECMIIDPAEVEYDGTRLRCSRGEIDLIYKRVLLAELVERGGLDHPILRAVRDHKVCMVNPPSCKILHKKASLAVLHDERNAYLFDQVEREAIAASIPWTRVVEERKTTVNGAHVDLLTYIAGNRDQLVLKPNDEYGGKGIVLGWEVDDAAWTDAIALALVEPYIAQQRIALPTEPYPSFVDGRVVITDRMVDTAPYVAYGDHVDGCLTRLATASLLNVTAGGGSQTPTFIAERRPVS
ncbi:MAG: Circularly permuted ATP-grasp type 2 [Gemmatimonadetes bacterium]|nr:Circularly permuted ATP-grasp type 2 [Gemmatimonadota bacterium]